MREIVEPPRRGENVSVPTFGELDSALRELAEAREAAAVAPAATPALLEQLDRAIAVAARSEDLLSQAMKPIPKAGVVAYLGLLLKAYPNPGSQDAAIFGGFMRDDVMSLEPSFGAVEMACRRWRRKSKFLPAIAEMMLEVKVAKSELGGAAEFVIRLPRLRAECAAALSSS
ncbi:hypothetical protein [Bradyrhizobium cenepequi]